MACLTNPAVITSGMDWNIWKPHTFIFTVEDIPIVMIPLHEIEQWFLSISETNYTSSKTIFILNSNMKLYPSGQGA